MRAWSLVRVVIVALVAFGLVGPLASPAIAQTATGGLQIIVSDEDGNTLSDACVSVVDEFGGYGGETCTDGLGTANFYGLPGGVYTVTMFQAPAGYLAPEPVRVEVIEGQITPLTLTVTAEALVEEPPTATAEAPTYTPEPTYEPTPTAMAESPSSTEVPVTEMALSTTLSLQALDDAGSIIAGGPGLGASYELTELDPSTDAEIGIPFTVTDTDGDGFVHITSLAAGSSYKVAETQAPPGYTAANLWIFTGPLVEGDNVFWMHHTVATTGVSGTGAIEVLVTAGEGGSPVAEEYVEIQSSQYVIASCWTGADGRCTVEPAAFMYQPTLGESVIALINTGYFGSFYAPAVAYDPGAPNTLTVVGPVRPVGAEPGTVGNVEMVVTDGGAPVAGTWAGVYIPTSDRAIGSCKTDAAGTCVIGWHDGPATAGVQLRGLLLTYAPDDGYVTYDPSVVNTLTIAIGASGEPTYASDPMSLTQWAMLAGSTGWQPIDEAYEGDAVTFSFQVSDFTGAGLTGVSVVTDRFGTICEGLSVSPMEWVICEYTYTLTAEDAAAGRIEIATTASADGVASTGYTFPLRVLSGPAEPPTQEPPTATATADATQAAQAATAEAEWVQTATAEAELVLTLTAEVAESPPATLVPPTATLEPPTEPTATAEVSQNTSTGTNVTVQPSTDTTVTFENVTQAGETTVTAMDTPPALPAGYLQVGALYYDVSTTAVFAGLATICFAYDPAAFADPNSLSLLHYENGAWTNVTTSNDTVTGQICGSVTSFSPFALAPAEDMPTATATAEMATGTAALTPTVLPTATATDMPRATATSTDVPPTATDMPRATATPVPPTVTAESPTATSVPENTTTGSDVTVQPSGDTSITFGTVTTAGETTVSPATADASLPTNFSLDGALFYDVHTTATFEGSATLCFTYDPASFANPAALSLLHYEEGIGWVDVTVSNDTVNGQICGSVSSFSPFVIASAAMTLTGFHAPVEMIQGVANEVKGGSTVPLKFNVYQGRTEVTDPTAVTVTIRSTSCRAATGTDPVEGTSLTATGTALRYDGTPGAGGQFVQNWKTPKVSETTCYTVTATSGGTSVTTLFQLKP